MSRWRSLAPDDIGWLLVGSLFGFGAITSASVGPLFLAVAALIAIGLVLDRKIGLLRIVTAFGVGVGLSTLAVSKLVLDEETSSILRWGGIALSALAATLWVLGIRRGRSE